LIQAWTVLQPSAREWRLWAVAVAAGVASSMVLIYGALAMDPRHPGRTGTAAALAAAAVAVAAAMRRSYAQGTRELRIAADGVPWIRAQPSAGRAADESPARPVFVAPWLITLRSDATWVAVWPDSLPPDAFRRLHGCVRWARSEPRSATAPPRPGHDDDPTD
jgi:hypothetical protein